jgi:hypothetical protein
MPRLADRVSVADLERNGQNRRSTKAAMEGTICRTILMTVGSGWALFLGCGEPETKSSFSSDQSSASSRDLEMAVSDHPSQKLSNSIAQNLDFHCEGL